MIKYTEKQIEELDKFYKHPRNLVDLFEDTVVKWGDRNAIGTKNIQTKQASDKFGNLLPMGHFYQDNRTLDFIIGDGWEIVSRSVIPEHRDTVIHLRKL